MIWAARSRVKIERAQKHISDLDAAAKAFLDSRPYDFTIDNNYEAGGFAATFRATREPPLELGTIAGDAIHNLRGALSTTRNVI